MPKTLLMIYSKFGNVIQVIKSGRTYFLTSGDKKEMKTMMKKKETDEIGVTAIKTFVDSLLSEGWQYEMV